MRLPDAFTVLRQRFRRPAMWALALILPGFLGSILAAVRPETASLGGLIALLALVTLWWGGGVFMAALPWQWSGSTAAPAGWFRGVFQSVILIAAWAGLIALLTEFRWTGLHQGFHSGHWERALGVLTPLSLPLVVLGYGLARAERLEEEVREAEAQARSMEWAGQRGSFPPQLLFETLDALAAGAPGDARLVEQGLLDLAALYRQWLIQGQESSTTLGVERALVERYLAVEQRCLGPHLRLKTSWPEGLAEVRLPSMLLLGLSQWSLEVGRASGVGVDLRVEAREAEGGLQVEFLCSGKPSASAMPTLDMLRVRLERWEGGGSLTLHPEEGQFRVILCAGGHHAMV